MSENATAVIPPHPGLDHLTNVGELKHKCPAFSSGCPYASFEEVDSLAVSFGEVSKCPAFQKGCPFSNKSKDEIQSMMSQIPKEHPVLNINELPSCDEGIVLVKLLNQFLTEAQREMLFGNNEAAPAKSEEDDILADPELASAMREGTKVVHRAAETSIFTKRFLKGEINRDEYGRYLTSLYFVYTSMEELLEKYKDDPVVQIIHFPTELSRRESLLRDLEFYYGKDRVAELIDPATMTPAVKTYVQAMEDACTANCSVLIAHSYSRYLGDLSGGQILAKRLKKCVLRLEEGESAWDSNQGLEFYHFENLGNQAEFKAFYRERLNAAKVNARTRDMIVSEAVRSFELNIAVFDEVQELSEANKLVPTVDPAAEDEQEIISLEEVDVKIETVRSVAPKKGCRCSGRHWVAAITVGVAVVAIGAAVYQQYARRK
ncbi:hypothetical protein DFQ28_006946 [Apophysomyces sp. BC1034]|nr:hypothetical protein DFQ30_004719 [Apophysomyces sp. BC1015]KAG0177279.1 hypothetical protein DFQ29_005035 [Apophysomyces sp. BC1021]KAG0187045.1 hypothetical protein DFQ28_006946 [Apophysomyces sp. BC1034]